MRAFFVNISDGVLCVYRGLCFLAWPVYPLILWWRLYHGAEDKPWWRQKMGECLPARPKGGVIWMHGVSVGESMALEGVMRALLASGKDTIVLTTSTASSARLWRKKIAACDTLRGRVIHTLCPLDHPLFWRRFLNHWRPRCFLLSEHDFWPHLFWALHNRRIMCTVLGARMSAKSARFWLFVKPLFTSIWRDVVCCVPSDTQASLFKALGARHVHVLGSLKWTKLDPALVQAHNRYPSTPGKTSPMLSKPPFVISAVSTHVGEEKAWLDLYPALKKRYPHLVLILAPRHTKRVSEVCDEVIARGVKVERWQPPLSLKAVEGVVIVDKMGVLRNVYAHSHIVFVGGSLFPGVGGHDLIDPAAYGCCVLCGPFMEAQADVFALFQQKKAVGVVQASTMGEQVSGYLDEQKTCELMGNRAQALVQERYHTVLQGYMTLLTQQGVVHA
ncbi:hypothetical protein EIL50_02500 [bacterium NHP-B]|nr:hypothetical protein EIL50_02500 [bacterium NHP-B]